MKLANKLLLFIAGSKLAVAALFILLLPFLVKQIASEYTNYTLQAQQKEVMQRIRQNGIEFYLQGEESYGSYTLLKEEYISLEPSTLAAKPDTIKESRRVIERDTLNYRVLSHAFIYQQKNYLLEIGKTINSIHQYNQPLQRFALYVLLSLILLTIVVDITFTRILIQPLGKIIQSKLINRKFPFKRTPLRIKTSTTDFKYLDESIIILMQQINEAFTKEKEFTANASHELMTPVSILQNKLENMLRDEELSESAEQRIIEMMRTLERLKKIAASLLLISRIDNEQFIKTDDVHLLQFISHIFEEINHRVEEKNIQVSLGISDKILLYKVNADLLFQLFYNLINNAIKFNNYGGDISINAKMLDNGDLEVKINDTGQGISSEQIPYIFDRFRKNNQQNDVGYGLGLSIVKSIANYHQLHLSVQSAEEKGTSFILKFPSEIIKSN